MLPLLLNKIIQTDKLLFLHLVTQKNRIYTFLNPVSYLVFFLSACRKRGSSRHANIVQAGRNVIGSVMSLIPILY